MLRRRERDYRRERVRCLGASELYLLCGTLMQCLATTSCKLNAQFSTLHQTSDMVFIHFSMSFT